MVYSFLWMKSHLNTSFTHLDKRTKISCFNLHCPQLLLVNRSAANFLEDDIPPNQGGAAVEQGSGWCCCKHPLKAAGNLAPSASEVGEVNLWLTSLHNWLQTRSNQLTVFVPSFLSILLLLMFPIRLPQRRERKLEFFFLDKTQVVNT